MMRFFRRVGGLIMLPQKALAGVARGSGSSKITLAAQARASVAPLWRRLLRSSIVLVGFGIFVGFELWMAWTINNWRWWLIIAFFVICGSIALATARPIIALIAWLVISPFGKHFLYLKVSTYAVPTITFDFIAIYYLGLLFAIQAMAEKRPFRKLIVAEWLMILYAIYAAVRLIATLDLTIIREPIGAITQTLIPEVFFIVVLYFVVKTAIKEERHIKWILGSMVVFGLLMGLVAFYEHFAGQRWYSLVIGFGIPLAWSYEGVAKGRASGMFDHASAPAALIATHFFLTYHLAGWAKQTWVRILCYASLVIIAIGAYYTYTRNVYIVFLLVTLLMPLLASGKRYRFAMITAMVLLSILITGPILLEDRGFNKRLTRTDTLYARMVYERTTLNVIKHNLWTGVGYDKLNDVSADYVTSLKHMNYEPGSNKLGWVNISHNTHLTILAEEGILGALLYYGAVAAFLIRLFTIGRKLPANDFLGKDLAAIFVASSVGFLVSMITASVYTVPYLNFIFWTQFAVMVRLEELRAAKQEGASAAIGQLRTEREPVLAGSGK